MTLKLEQISQMVGGQMNLYPLNLTLVPNAVTVLLGATQAGKTSLMRLMAGLDTPTEGRVWVDGKDVTGMGVRERNVAMVYQQFINYPSMNVYDNIASPLRLRGDKDTDAQVRALAARLRIDPFLDRLPAALSGGQQQRVALARALAKQAPLMFLDEPLVNLDYKLREELREDLTQLFEAGSGTGRDERGSCAAIWADVGSVSPTTVIGCRPGIQRPAYQCAASASHGRWRLAVGRPQCIGLDANRQRCGPCANRLARHGAENRSTHR